MITHEKIKSVLEQWNLSGETVSDFYDANSGQRIDNTWRVGERYIMQVGTNITGLRNHIAVSEKLKAQSFAAALPVKTISGEDF